MFDGLDGKAFAEEMVEVVRGYVDRSTQVLLARIEELEARAAVPGPAGEPGSEGPQGETGPQGEAGPAGERGPQGEPGPQGEKGLDGAPGRDGIDGKDAEPITREQIVEAILAMPDVLDEAVQRHLSLSPPPAGKDGQDGAPGRDGIDGQKGEDGVGLASAFIDREGQLVVTMTNGETRELGMVVGRDGTDGLNGKDGSDGERGPAGFSLDDFDTELKGDGRTLLLKFMAGDTAEIHEIGFPVSIYRGVFKDGQPYEHGDMVTWAGSLWHCDADTLEKPGEGSASWTLAVKRGRDGKNGEKGEKGDPGRAGKDAPKW